MRAPIAAFLYLLVPLAGCSSEAPATAVSSQPALTEPVPAATSAPVVASTSASALAEPAEAITLPPIEGWERGATRQLEHEPGFSLPYNRESRSGALAATVYVFKRGLSSIPTGASSDAVKREVDSAVDAINELVRLKEYRSATVLSRDKTTFGDAGVGVEAQRVVLKIVPNDRPLVKSTILVTGAKNNLVKIRLSHSEQIDAADSKAIEQLLQGLGNALR